MIDNGFMPIITSELCVSPLRWFCAILMCVWFLDREKKLCSLDTIHQRAL